jgi:hypothetical protein
MVHDVVYSSSWRDGSTQTATEYGTQLLGSKECWYNSINFGKLRLTEPNPRLTLGLMVAGWSLIVVLYAGSILIVVLRKFCYPKSLRKHKYAQRQPQFLLVKPSLPLTRLFLSCRYSPF